MPLPVGTRRTLRVHPHRIDHHPPSQRSGREGQQCGDRMFALVCSNIVGRFFKRQVTDQLSVMLRVRMPKINYRQTSLATERCKRSIFEQPHPPACHHDGRIERQADRDEFLQDLQNLFIAERLPLKTDSVCILLVGPEIDEQHLALGDRPLLRLRIVFEPGYRARCIDSGNLGPKRTQRLGNGRGERGKQKKNFQRTILSNGSGHSNRRIPEYKVRRVYEAQNITAAFERSSGRQRFASLRYPGAGNSLLPMRNRSTARAAPRPSLIAQTTSDWPRRQSPAAKTPSTLVAKLPPSAAKVSQLPRGF